MESKNNVNVISLDDVDLNLLPISHRCTDGGAVPLWIKSNLDSKRNEYYDNKSDDTKKGENDTVIENITCHICDIIVPEVYFNEHKNSFRHKFNTKVADTALKRLQLYINNDDIFESDDKLLSKHFCTVCSIVVDTENETSHEQTTGHRNSVFLERFLNDFLNFYTNDGNVHNTGKDMQKKCVKESKNTEQNFITDEANSENTRPINSKKESKKTKNVKDTKGDKHSERITNSDEPNNNIDPSCDLKDGEIIVQICDQSNIDNFKVSKLYYNAIVKTSAPFEYCMICDELYVKENRNLHLDSDIHDENLHQKSLDKNCVRKINISHHQCVLCNDYFIEYDLHVNSKEHLTNLQNQIISKCKKTVPDNDIFKKDNKFDNIKAYSNVLTSDGINNLTCANKNIAVLNKETSNSFLPSTSSSVISKMVENNDKTVKFGPYICNVCQVQVPNNLNNITEHNNGKSHKLKVNKQTEAKEVDTADKISEIDENKETRNILEGRVNSSKHSMLFCDDCKVWISRKEFKKHGNTWKHRFNVISNYQYLLEYSYKRNSFCKICKEAVSSVVEDIKNHFISSDHISKYKLLLRAQSIIKLINKFYCMECKVYIQHKNEYLHIKSKEHTYNMGFSDTADGGD